MEKKSIGQFIATLRKANGMTQRQLAEKLNVSDKAVSRWERDENAPDLTLIPVIAEIFQVTSDELLRGEKQNSEVAVSPRALEKTEKQIENLFKSVMLKMKIRGLVSVGIASVGLIIAMVCNFALERAYLGFFISCAFYVIATICELIFAMQAFYSVNNNEFTSKGLGICKRKLIKSVENTFLVIVNTFALSLSQIIYDGGAYRGVDEEEWLFMGLLLASISTAVYMFIIWRINVRKFREYCEFESEIVKEDALNKVKKEYIFLTVIVLAVTFIFQSIYMETPVADLIDEDIIIPVFLLSYFLEIIILVIKFRNKIKQHQN